jgi:transposase
MERGSILGIDLAKSSFVVCGLDKDGKQVLRQEFSRVKFAEFIDNTDPCDVFMEACGSAHFWGRKLRKSGHSVNLIAAQKVVGFRKCNKNDRNDALAIAIAGKCPGMEFVPVKSIEQQDLQSVVRIRARLIYRQTALVNEMRGLLAEYGVTIAEGIAPFRSKLSEMANGSISDFPGITPTIFQCVVSANEELLDITKRVEEHEALIHELTKKDDRCRRLQDIPGVGPLTAAAVIAAVTDPGAYKNGRQFAASIGLTPRHVQTGGKDSKPVHLGISKHGNPVLRSMLVQGAMAVASRCRMRMKKAAKGESSEDSHEKQTSVATSPGRYPCRERTKKKAKKKTITPVREEWMRRMLTERGMQKTAVAIANRNARVILSLLKSGDHYHPLGQGQPSYAAS